MYDMVLNEKEINIVLELLDSSIDNYKNVLDRTKKDRWVSKIDEIKFIKNKFISYKENLNKYGKN